MGLDLDTILNGHIPPVVPFDYIYENGPIDFWEGATIPSDEGTQRVLRQMPEEPMSRIVYKLYIFHSEYYELIPVYLCKADNNGTVYIFSDYNLRGDFIYSEYHPEYRNAE